MPQEKESGIKIEIRGRRGIRKSEEFMDNNFILIYKIFINIGKEELMTGVDTKI